VTPLRQRVAGLRQSWRERLIQALLAILLGVGIYWRVSEGYGAGAAVVAAVCGAWGYLILSTYIVRLMEAGAGSNRPRGPQSPGGRWPGARP
jgi:hypothetical protein